MTNDDGSQTMVSYPQVSHNALEYISNILKKVPIKFPNNLKKDLTDWSTKVRNMYTVFNIRSMHLRGKLVMNKTINPCL